jgi:uncharacterized membrane-anchored protein
MSGVTKVIAGLAIVFIIGLVSGFMYLVTTFLFNFSGGQVRMGPVVHYGAIAVVALMLLLAVIVWRVRSPIAALVVAAIATPVAWVLAVVVEWGFSQFVYVTGAG